MDGGVDVSRYRAGLPGLRGMRLHPMVFRVKPAPYVDESFLGVVARSASRNGFDRLTQVFRLADFKTGSDWSATAIRTADPDVVQRLAFVMKVSEEDLGSKLYRPLNLLVRKDMLVDFFGAEVRKIYLHTHGRRSSPRSLAEAPYHRAIHDIRPLSFCPYSMEMLIDHCPVCRGALTWRETLGIPHCARCVDEWGRPSVDLRDYLQPLVDEDPVPLRLVAGIIDPDPRVRSDAVARVDPKLSTLGPGDLFDLCIGLARVLMAPPDGNPNPAGPGTFIHNPLPPAIVARVGRALMDWDPEFSRIADEMREFAPARSGYGGLLKELGSLNSLTYHGVLTETARDFVKGAILADMERTAKTAPGPRRRAILFRDDLVDLSTAAAILNSSHHYVRQLIKSGHLSGLQHSLRGATYIPRDELAPIKLVRDDMWEGRKAARALGMSLGALEMLADAGRIHRAQGPAADVAVDRVFYRTSGLRDFARRLVANRTAAPPAKKIAPFCNAFGRLRPGHRPWVEIFDAMIDGSLKTYFTGGGDDTLHATALDIDELRVRYPGIKPTGAPAQSNVRLSYREAAALLGVPAPNVSWLVAAGVLKTTGDYDRRLRRAAIDEFNASYAHTAEVAAKLGISAPDLKRALAAKGIHPAAALHNGVRLIWRRADVFERDHWQT